MKLYEHQAKSLFRQHNIPVPEGEFVEKERDLPRALKKIGKGPWAIKVQILAGGRGKAGGVQIVRSPKEIRQFFKKFSGRTIVTHQTGPLGEKVAGVLIEKTEPAIAEEMYVSVLLDRKSESPLLIASRKGGMEIETQIKEKPDSLLRVSIDPQQRLPLHRARLIAHDLGFSGKILPDAAQFLSRLVNLFFESDATLVEVNPWILTKTGETKALDGKIITDDNALFRHIDQDVWLRSQPQTPAEKRAHQAKISYIKLDGNVGCLVNGAGLAMATMDIIKHHGGEPANFLDVGGGANADQVTEAFKIILADPQVKGILVNIFGGIMKCDVIATGILTALKQIKLKVPLVVRLEGTRVQEGKELLAESRLPIIPANSLDEAAQLIVRAAKEN